MGWKQETTLGEWCVLSVFVLVVASFLGFALWRNDMKDSAPGVTNEHHIPGVNSSQSRQAETQSAGIMILGGVILIGFIMWLNRASSKPRGKTGPAKYFPDAPEIIGPGEFDWDVVGESCYQAALHKICGGKKPEGVEYETRATLAFEPNNPINPRAVVVHIDGMKVGYLSDDDAESFRTAVDAAKLRSSYFSVGAMIVGGWDRGGGNEGMFGVKLDLPLEDSEVDAIITVNK